MGNRNTVRDKCRLDWASRLDCTLHFTHFFDNFNIELITVCSFILQIDEAVHHDQLVMLEKLYNAFTKVDLAAGNQVIYAVYLFRV